MANTSQHKPAVRTAMAKRLGELTPATRHQLSAALCGRLHPLVAPARSVALFAPRQDEPDLRLLGNRPFWTGRTPLFPRVERDQLVFVESRWNALVLGRFGLLEPTGTPHPHPPAVVLVPGLAFSRQGDRLGRGRGFYDRYLPTLPAATLRIGVCFGTQVLPGLPCDEADARVHLVVTEREVIRCRASCPRA